jgi:fructokinase
VTPEGQEPSGLASGREIDLLQQRLYAGIEAGGTKFVCVVARGIDEVLEEIRIPTTTPAETMGEVVRFFVDARARHGSFAAFGIGTFGPVDLRPGSPTWGCLLDTPKTHWSGADLVRPLVAAFECPIVIETDVNAAALAELQYGAGRGCRSLAYITVGTGIGGGAVIDGRPLHGLLHPEMGHVRVQRDPRDLTFAGTCPFHGDCLEGLASGPAIRARWGASLDELGDGHVAFDIIGHYLGQLAATITLVLSSERIVFGGGVMQSAALFPPLRRAAEKMLANYLPTCRADWAERHLVPPALGDRSGRVGAISLAMSADGA